jgi:hypothetical protein
MATIDASIFFGARLEKKSRVKVRDLAPNVKLEGREEALVMDKVPRGLRGSRLYATSTRAVVDQIRPLLKIGLCW